MLLAFAISTVAIAADDPEKRPLTFPKDWTVGMLKKHVADHYFQQAKYEQRIDTLKEQLKEAQEELAAAKGGDLCVWHVGHDRR